MTTTPKGTVYQRSADGPVAVRMGPAVTAGDYFVIDPDNGGYYTSATDVEEWTPLVFPAPAETPEPAPAATA